MKAMTLDAPGEAQDSFAALAAAVHPAWHQAIIRLVNATERVAAQLEAVMPTPLTDGLAGPVRELVRDLIDYLDLLERDDCELEPDEGAEPSLGWPERRAGMGQPGFWSTGDDDREQDDSDDEDDGTAEPSLGSLEHSCCAQGWGDGRNPTGDQTRWGHSARADLEEQCDDEGSAA